MGRKRGRHRRRKDRTLPLGTAVIIASAVAGIYLTASPDGASAASTTVYVAPQGSDGAAGTLASPYRTLGKAFSVARPGTTIEVRGGTYRPTRTLRSSADGTADRRIRLRPYHAERVTVDGSRLPRGSRLVSLAGDYWTVSDIEFRDAPASGVVCDSCANGVFDDLATHDNGASGFALRGRHTDHNLVRDLDSYRNHDDADHGRGADGLALASGSGTDNRVTGARLFDNSDDGLDLGGWRGRVEIAHSWAFGNGRNHWRIAGFRGRGDGFALGGTAPAPAVAHQVDDSAAWDNARDGFAAHHNAGALRLRRTTAYANRGSGYDFPFSHARFLRNVSAANHGPQARIGGPAVSDHDSWDRGVPTPPLITTGADRTRAPRESGGGLPTTAYLVPADDSKLGSPMAVSPFVIG